MDRLGARALPWVMLSERRWMVFFSMVRQVCAAGLDSCQSLLLHGLICAAYERCSDRAAPVAAVPRRGRGASFRPRREAPAHDAAAAHAGDRTAGGEAGRA